MPELSNTREVGTTDVLSIATVRKKYGAVYHGKVVFDLASLGLKPRSWIWTMLRELEAESAVAPISSALLPDLNSAIVLLAGNPEANLLLGQTAKRTNSAHIRRLFQLSEELVADDDKASIGRETAALRSFFFSRAHTVCFAELMDPQRVRFRALLPWPRGNPRPLISDLHDITDLNANLPIGALAATTAKQIVTAVKERADYDLEKIRSACIADLTAAAALRKRAKELRDSHVPWLQLSCIRKQVQRAQSAGQEFPKNGITTDIALSGVLKIIHIEKLATNSAKFVRYQVPWSNKLRALFLDGMAAFKSDRLLEIEYRACVEELFAAFHLLQTYLGWNWDSVSSLQADEIDLSTRGVVILQSCKSKTDDDTPVCSIDLTEPGVQMAIDILLWNREQLVKCGFLDRSEQVLWSTRPGSRGKQRAGYFSPQIRLADFIQRHSLPKERNDSSGSSRLLPDFDAV